MVQLLSAAAIILLLTELYLFLTRKSIFQAVWSKIAFYLVSAGVMALLMHTLLYGRKESGLIFQGIWYYIYLLVLSAGMGFLFLIPLLYFPVRDRMRAAEEGEATMSFLFYELFPVLLLFHSMLALSRKAQIIRNEWIVPMPQSLSFVHISDLHIGSTTPDDFLDNWKKKLQNLPPLLFISGDIVNRGHAHMERAITFLQRIRPMFSLGVYAVRGNHDADGPSDLYFSKMQKTGVTFLRNEHILRKDLNIAIAGLDYPPRSVRRHERAEWLREAATRALSGIPENYPVILLLHDPYYAPMLDFGERKNVFILSGHTHGGSVCWRDSLGRERSAMDSKIQYRAGAYEVPGARLYVNRGLGDWFPYRFGCPNEITVHTIEGKNV